MPSESGAGAGAGAGTSNHVYVRSNDYAWVPARVVEYRDEKDSRDNNKVTKVVVNVSQYKNEDAICSDGGRTAIRAGKTPTETIDLKSYPNQTLPLQNVDENGMLLQVEDMVDLPFLHEPAILYNLKARHQSGKPYTRTGDIIIAVNPYQWMMNLYTDANKAHYSHGLVWNSDNVLDDSVDPRTTVEPHVYETSALAYRGLAVDGQDQSILVSGESGAGKTETVKILMSHIASIQTFGNESAGDTDAATATATATAPQHTTSTSTTSPIVQRVLDSNPLLEAFGNAKTVRNDNSSRFGKYLQLQFDAEDATRAAYQGKRIPSCVLAGSKCEVFLLEKSRVVGHEEDERTYHIFYQLLAAPDEEKISIWSGLEGTDQESFLYVGYTDTDTIEGKTDAARYELTKQALALIGVKDDVFLTLMRAMCIVLQLGNLLLEEDADDEEQSMIASMDELTALSELMGVPEDAITRALTQRTVRARNEEFTVPLKADQATDSRDALAKEIYAKTFLWLVRTINDATCAEWNYMAGDNAAAAAPNKTTDFGLISMLDIFGFESFRINRFEQLCINHANEKLQQKFTQDIFRSVQAEYEFEGIELGEIQYEDNAYVLDLVEGRMGMIAVLNEECLRPKGSDTAFVAKVQAVSKDSEAFFVEKGFHKVQFGINHYAGKVVYDATNFVQKNMDALPSDLLECAKKSSNAIVANELENELMVNEHGAKKKKVAPSKKAGSRAPPHRSGSTTRLVHSTVWTKFRSQLNSLMQLLGETRTRYIRCIKPNTRKQPLSMMHQSTVEQLRCAGVVAAVTISRSAFPNRLEHEIVLERFKSLWLHGEQHAEEGDDPIDARKKDVEHLLTLALRAHEVDTDGTSVQRAFVIGRTRAYFRAGALEHLEAERLKGLATRATEIQRIVRGFVAKSQFRRKRRAAIRAVAQMRCFVQSCKYRRTREAIIMVQCWIRCIQSSDKLIVLRRNHAACMIQKIWRSHLALESFRLHKAAAISIQAIARGAIQRPRFCAALAERREEAKLENQLKTLQRKLEEAEQKRMEAEKKAAEKPKEIVIVKEREKPQEEMRNEAASAVSVSSQSVPNHAVEKDESVGAAAAAAERTLTAQQQALMDESGRMLEYLRKEVFKLRSHNAQLRTDFDLLKENNQRLMDANASAGASFAALNQHAKQLNKTNVKLSTEVAHYKQQMQRMHLVHVEVKEELKMKQATYIAEVHSRLQYQKTMVKIVDAIQERCRDSRLVEDILQLSDECEEAHMEGPTSFGANASSNNAGGVNPLDANDSIVSRFKSFFS